MNLIKKNNKKGENSFNVNLYNKIRCYFKSLTYKDYIKFLIIFLILIISYYIFMKFTLIITVDGSKYYSYLDYFKGIKNIGTWDTIRGFSFPLIIYLITLLFGANIRGIVFGFYLFYIGMLFFGYKIIATLIVENKIKKSQITIWMLYLLAFLFNPLIIGYGHTLLTEAITPFFYVMLIYICIKWNKMSFRKSKKQFIIYSVIIVLLSVFVWFIKQPYAPAIWIMIFTASILSGLYNHNCHIFLQKFLVFIICLISTFISVKAWNLLIESHNESKIINITNSSILANTLEGYSYHFIQLNKDTYCSIEYVKNSVLDENDKQKVYDLINNNAEWCDFVNFYDITGIDGNRLEQLIIIKNNKDLSLSESLSFLIKAYVNHPVLVAHSYFENYLGIINLERVNSNYVASGRIEPNVGGENAAIAYITFHEGYKNAWWLWQDKKQLSNELIELSTGMENYESVTNTDSVLSPIMEILSDGSNLSFKLLLLICFPVMVYAFIRYLINKKSISYFVITLLSATSFGHIMFHVFTGAIIDRYCYPVYPLMLLCLIAMIMEKNSTNEKM